MYEDDELPEGWVLARLRDVVSPGGIRNPRMSKQIEFLYVDIEAVDNITQKIVAPRKLSTADAPSRARMAIQVGDIIFSLVRPYLKNIAIVPQELDGQVASTAYCVIRPEVGVLSRFILYTLLRESFIASIKTYGNTPPCARDDEFLDMYIPVAPTEEQKHIVEAIEQHLSLLDSTITSLQKDKIRLKHAHTSVLKAAVEGELTAEWRTEHPVTETAPELLQRILIERHKKWEEVQLAKMEAKGTKPKDDRWKENYKEPLPPDMRNLTALPEGWCWATVDQVTSRSEYGTSVKCDYGVKGTPVLRIPNIVAGEVDLSDMKYALRPLSIDQHSSLQPGDLLLCRTNGSLSLIGKAALIRVPLEPYHTFASYLLRFRLSESSILPKWVHIFMSSEQGRSFIESNASTTAGQYNISLTLMHTMPFPLPPLSEQQQIIDEVECILSDIIHTEKEIDVSLKRAERSRQGILEEAFAGRLAAQDPDDEPAYVLLEHIREERVRRTQEEQERRKEGRKMTQDGERKKSVARQRVPLVEALLEAKRPLEAEELFRMAGLQANRIEDIDDFYDELREEINKKRRIAILPSQEDNTRIFLEVVGV